MSLRNWLVLIFVLAAGHCYAQSINGIPNQGLTTVPCNMQQSTNVIMADCYSTLNAANSAATSLAATNSIGETVLLSPGKTYNVSSTLDTTGTSRACVNYDVVGGRQPGELPGSGVANIFWTGGNSPVFQHTTSFTTKGCTFANININANFSSSNVINNLGQDRFHFINVTVQNPADGSQIVIDGSTEYEVYEDNMTIALQGAGGATAVTLGGYSGGTFSTATFSTTSAIYHYPKLIFSGCSTPPTATLTTSGTPSSGNVSVSAATLSGGSGCQSTATAQILDLVGTYGLYHAATDGGGGPVTLQSVGSVASMYIAKGANFYTGGQIHCYQGELVCIEDHGGNHGFYEADTALGWDINEQGPNSFWFGRSVFSNTAIPNVTDKSLVEYGSTAINNTIYLVLSSIPNNGIPYPYNYNGTWYSAGDPSGLSGTGNQIYLESNLSGPGTTAIPVVYGQFAQTSFNTLSICNSSASPAICGSAVTGHVSVAAGLNPTLTINTTGITANSSVQLTVDQSLGSALGVTCNTTLPSGQPTILTRTPGTSLTIEVPGTFTTNPVCVNYDVTN